MKTFIAYLSYIGLMLAISLMANLAQAFEICETELRPYYLSVKQFDGTEQRTKELITQYHARRDAVYSICDSEKIRKFEASFTSKVNPKEKSQLETLGYFPKPRKILDLGETEARSPASRSY